MPSISDIGEDALIESLTSPLAQPAHVLVGPGDDCAVVDLDPSSDQVQLLKTDCIIESVHYLPDTAPERIGWKAMARVVSDIAAMGGTPLHALVTIAASEDKTVAEIEGWYRGMNQLADTVGGLSIVGGETASLPQPGAIISIAMTGTVPRDHYVTRCGAQPGDLIAVTGPLGGSFHSERHLDFTPRLAEGQAIAPYATAMMDLSDGLAKDLPRLADRSGGLGYQIDLDAIPIHPDSDLAGAIGDGEDYELLVALPPTAADRAAALGTTIIGAFTEPGQRTPLDGGWEHFRGKTG